MMTSGGRVAPEEDGVMMIVKVSRAGREKDGDEWMIRYGETSTGAAGSRCL
jgi:hypothetical protein